MGMRWMATGVCAAAVVGAAVFMARALFHIEAPQTFAAQESSARDDRAVRAAPAESADPTAPAAAAETSPKPAAAETALTPAKLFAKASPAVVMIMAGDGSMKWMSQGTGFFLSSDGLVATNFHVIRNATTASIQTTANQTLPVEGIVAADAKADLAILKVKTTGAPVLVLSDADPPPVGTQVYAIGNPEGLTNTLSEGLVSGVRKNFGGIAQVQTTAPISHGSSGGPLLTSDGRVIGVTASTGVEGQNLNFAVPASLVARLLRDRGEVRPLSTASRVPTDDTSALVQDTDSLRDAWNCINSGRSRDALVLLDSLREREASNPLYWFTAGCANSRLRNFETASIAFRKAIQLKPNYAAAYYELGESLIVGGRYTDAIDALKQAARFEPKDAKIYREIGATYAALGDDASAITWYARAINLDGSDWLTYRLKGISFYKLQQFADAVEALTAAGRLHPDVTTFCALGECNLQLKDFDSAKDAYQRATRLSPGSALAFLGLAIAETGLKDTSAALDDFDIVIRLDPRGRAGAVAKTYSERLRNDSSR